MKWHLRLLLLLCLGIVSARAQNLTPVTESSWGLKIVIFDVGQGDGALLLTPNGQAVIIDMGETKTHGATMAAYLLNQSQNGVGRIDTVDLLFASHYDQDHIGGARGLTGKIKAKAAYDQGPSAARDPKNPKGVYTAYVRFVGDKDGDGVKDPGENAFVRHQAEPGQSFTLGANGDVQIRVLSVRGDTAGTAHDIDLRPNKIDFDENPGSIIQLVALNDFEYLTTGDASSNDWKSEPDTEEAVIQAGAIPGGNDIDLLKVSHHGSDTSSGSVFVQSTRPELAIISSGFKANHRLPKLTSIKILEQSGATVLVTGSARDGTGKYHQSKHVFDNGFAPARTTDKLGRITILVAKDGSKYTVRSEKQSSLALTFRSRDP